MLKGIPDILPPELLKYLMEMGHGDELVIADGNFPKFAHPHNVVRCDGQGIPALLDAILQLMPLDPYVEQPVIYMDVLLGDDYQPVIWQEYNRILQLHGEVAPPQKIHKKDFYSRAQGAFALVTTSERALYANIIVKKGVL